MKYISAALDLLGVTAITTGAALAWPPLGFIVGGAAALLIATTVGEVDE